MVAHDDQVLLAGEGGQRKFRVDVERREGTTVSQLSVSRV